MEYGSHLSPYNTPLTMTIITFPDSPYITGCEAQGKNS